MSLPSFKNLHPKMLTKRDFLKSSSAILLSPLFSYGQNTMDSFPSKPITLIVPFPAGQSGDILARALQEFSNKYLQQTLIIDNKGGAGGTIGSQIAAKAIPDGYTLLLGSSGPTAISPSLYKNVGYNPDIDFAPIINVAGVAQVLTVGIDSPFQNVTQLIEYAKNHPNKLSYGSGGNGSTAHLTMELFKAKAGIQIQHIPYKGAALAYPDLIAGRIDAMFDTTPAVIPLYKSGKIKALGVSTPTRSSSLPNIPTIKEAALKDFELIAWWGIVAPAGIPTPIQEKLNQAFKLILKEPSIQRKFDELGMTGLAGTTDEFKRYIHDEYIKFNQIIRSNNIVLE